MSFNHISIIHLNKYILNDFIFLYKNSDKYLFDIYESNNFDDDKIYHIICISNNIIDLYTFMNVNECDYKYIHLYKLYGSLLIINKSFKQKYQKYNYVCSVGKCKQNDDIKNSSKTILNMINKYYLQYLPVHYLDI